MKTNTLKTLVLAAMAVLLVAAGRVEAGVQVNLTVGVPCVHTPGPPPLCRPCPPHVIHLGPHHHHCHHPRHVRPRPVCPPHAHVHRPAPPCHVHRPAPPQHRLPVHHKPGHGPHRR